jgi:hypothetical protein
MQPERDDAPPLPAAAIVAINQGKVIEAIRIVREAAPGLGLKDAKDRVDSYIARDPMLQAQQERQRSLARGKLVKAVLFIDLLLAVAIVWYFFGR